MPFGVGSNFECMICVPAECVSGFEGKSPCQESNTPGRAVGVGVVEKKVGGVISSAYVAFAPTIDEELKNRNGSAGCVGVYVHPRADNISLLRDVSSLWECQHCAPRSLRSGWVAVAVVVIAVVAVDRVLFLHNGIARTLLSAGKMKRSWLVAY